MFTIKAQVIRNTAHRPSTQASYTIGSGTTMQENQPAAQIAAKHNIFSRMAPYMSWIFLVLVGIDPGVSRLGGEIVSHNTTDAVMPWTTTDEFNVITKTQRMSLASFPGHGKYTESTCDVIAWRHGVTLWCDAKEWRLETRRNTKYKFLNP